MSIAARQRLRLAVLSGFLGSGKTTWLRHQLHKGAFCGRTVIVNEAAAAAVDDALLADLAALLVITGGCICCSKRSDFINVLRRHCDTARPPDLVLETSGLAEPQAIIEAIRTDPVLMHHILVEDVLVTVDAVNAMAGLKSDPLLRRQIETADRLLITKLDGLGARDIAALAATLKAVNPGARIEGAVKGEEVALPDYAGIAAVSLPPLPGAGASGPVIAADIAIDPDIGWEIFSLWLSALLHARGDKIMRIKGVVLTPAGRVLLQSVQKSVLQPELLPETSGPVPRFDNRLAFIGRDFDQATLERSLANFRRLV